MADTEETLSPERLELKQKLEFAFDNTMNARIEKRQTGKAGRKVYVPVMTVLITAFYGVCVYFMQWVNVEYRIIGLVLGTALYAFFLARFLLCFAVDLGTAKHAERISYLRDCGKTYVFGEGKYVQKFEYDGGNLAMRHGDTYEKFSDKSRYSPLASRYDKHLQRRSCNRTVLSADFWIAKLGRGSFRVEERAIEATNADGEFRLEFDADGLISRIRIKGAAEPFYDSGSPLHVYDAKLPFDYAVDYEFTCVNDENFSLTVPELALDGIRDFLLPEVTSAKVVFA